MTSAHQAIPSLIDDLEARMGSRDARERADILDKVTSLFLTGAPRFGEEHVAVFDAVIGRLTDAIEIRARAQLSERLAPLDNAPLGVIERLANDEIAVARAVLIGSSRLSDDMLVQAALKHGRDHMLAISERKNLNEPVTDVLVEHGDRIVINAVAGNPTARFSKTGIETLIDKSRRDELLHATLTRRSDLPPQHMATLFTLAKEAARQRLETAAQTRDSNRISEAVERSASDIAAETTRTSRSFAVALAVVNQMVEDNQLTEAEIARFARSGHREETICALSYLARVPLSVAEKVFSAPEHDLLLITCRSINFGWDTVRALATLRLGARPDPRIIGQLNDSYRKLSTATAQRVLRFLHAREAVNGVRPPHPATPA